MLGWVVPVPPLLWLVALVVPVAAPLVMLVLAGQFSLLALPSLSSLFLALLLSQSPHQLQPIVCHLHGQ